MARHFVECPSLGFADVFLIIRLELWVFERKTTERECHIPDISRVPINIT